MKSVKHIKKYTHKKMKKYWIKDTQIGNIKRKIYRILQKRFQFADWHLTPINERPYAIEVVEYVQKYAAERNLNCIVEIGCGLGSIIGNIKTSTFFMGKRRGFDIDNNSIRTARLLHPFVKFVNGSFCNVQEERIDCLIMVDFIHKIPEDNLRNEILNLFKRNMKVDLIVFDTFRNNQDTEYLYSHKGEYLFDGKYRLLRRSRGFRASHGARRYIEYWEKI